jgi:hypothetical protein
VQHLYLHPLPASTSCFGLEEFRYQLFVSQPLAFDPGKGDVRALIVRNLEAATDYGSISHCA